MDNQDTKRVWSAGLPNSVCWIRETENLSFICSFYFQLHISENVSHYSQLQLWVLSSAPNQTQGVWNHLLRDVEHGTRNHPVKSMGQDNRGIQQQR